MSVFLRIRANLVTNDLSSQIIAIYITVLDRDRDHIREEIELCNRYPLLHSDIPQFGTWGLFFGVFLRIRANLVTNDLGSQIIAIYITVLDRDRDHIREEIELCNRYSLLHSIIPQFGIWGLFFGVFLRIRANLVTNDLGSQIIAIYITVFYEDRDHIREEIELCNRYPLLHSDIPQFGTWGLFFGVFLRIRANLVTNDLSSQIIAISITVFYEDRDHIREEIELCNRYPLLHSDIPQFGTWGLFFGVFLRIRANLVTNDLGSQIIAIYITVFYEDRDRIREEIELCNRYPLLHSDIPQFGTWGLFFWHFFPVTYRFRISISV